METHFKSIIQLMDFFKDEATCKAYLAQKRWGDIPCCPHCGNVGAYVTNRGYKCKAKECAKKFSVISGTIYENTKLPLRTWFMAMYLITNHKKGISSLQLSRDLNITQKNAWFLLHRIRTMVTDQNPGMLDGTVEVDETYIGGKEKNKHVKKQKKEQLGRGLDKAPVVAMVQRNGNVRAFATENVGGTVIYDIITKNIKLGSELITDGFNSYKWVGLQYDHVSVKHNENYITYGDKHTNSVEGFFSHLKRMIIGTYHYISPKHLQRYCNELTYRFNTREIHNGLRFEDAIRMCDNKRLTYAQLIAKI